MDFGLSEQQQQMQDTLHRYLVDAATLESVRATVADGPAQNEALWQGLAAMGLTGVLVPEEYGGLGLPLLDAVLIQEQLGRQVAPVEYTATAVVAAIALAQAGSTEQKERFLPGLVDGSQAFCIALGGAGGARDGAGLKLASDAVNGRALFVMGSAQAQHLLCSTHEGELVIVERDDPGASWTSLRSIDDTRHLWEVNLVSARAEKLGDATQSIVDNAVAAGRIALAADTLGASQAMLEQAVAYASERKQFNRLIGSFQAVKHLCAEMAAEIEPCRSLVWYAGHAFDTAPNERLLMACHAKAHLSEVGTFVARTATEVHGGMGFTDLLGLHYWFKRIGFNRQLLGSPERLRDQAAQLQGWLDSA